MKNAIILHGRPSKAEYYGEKFPSMSNAHWLPWLQAQLLKKDIIAVTPEVPFAFAPEWSRWVKEVNRFEIGPETILVGHSTGAGFWVRWLSDNPDAKVGKVVLIAPYLDVEKQEEPEFFDFTLDKNISSRTGGLTIFHSDNDQASVQSTTKLLRNELKDFKYVEFHNYGHFTIGSMKTPEFPELLEECLAGNT
jgi:predicted alpha/beta hydrolase family esterase